MVRRRKMALRVTEAISAMGKDHHTSSRRPVWARSHAAGSRTTNWRQMDTTMLYMGLPMAWHTEPAIMQKPASYHDVCVAMENAAQNSMKGIITCTSDQVVSSDLTGFSQTCIFDETAGIMLDDDFVKLIAWYDNEWGYTNKLLDLIAHMYEVDSQS